MSNVQSKLFNVSKVFLISSSIIYSSFGADNIDQHNPEETYQIGLAEIEVGNREGGIARIGNAASNGHKDALTQLSKICIQYQDELNALSINWNKEKFDKLYPKIKPYFNVF